MVERRHKHVRHRASTTGPTRDPEALTKNITRSASDNVPNPAKLEAYAAVMNSGAVLMALEAKATY